MENVSVWSSFVAFAWIAILASFAPLLYFKFRGLSGDYETRDPQVSSQIITWSTRICSGAALIASVNIIGKVVLKQELGYLIGVAFIYWVLLKSYSLAGDAYEVINRVYESDEPAEEQEEN